MLISPPPSVHLLCLSIGAETSTSFALPPKVHSLCGRGKPNGHLRSPPSPDFPYFSFKSSTVHSVRFCRRSFATPRRGSGETESPFTPLTSPLNSYHDLVNLEEVLLFVLRLPLALFREVLFSPLTPPLEISLIGGFFSQFQEAGFPLPPAYYALNSRFVANFFLRSTFPILLVSQKTLRAMLPEPSQSRRLFGPLSPTTPENVRPFHLATHHKLSPMNWPLFPCAFCAF